MTVQQFWDMPDDMFPEAYIHELNFGEIVASPRPKFGVYEVQHRVSQLLDRHLGAFGEVGFEMPYRPMTEFEYRRADVAFVSKTRWDAVDLDNALLGSPDLVVEVRMPSTTDQRLREIICLALGTGAREVWIVDPPQKLVGVYGPNGVPVAFFPGDTIPLTTFGGDPLSVDEIFT